MERTPILLAHAGDQLGVARLRPVAVRLHGLHTSCAHDPAWWFTMIRHASSGPERSGPVEPRAGPGAQRVRPRPGPVWRRTMKTSMIGALVGAGVLVSVPAIALAGNVLVDHGRGPTVVHDAAYAGVTTQVHSWARDGGTDLRLMVRGLPANRPFGAHVRGTVRRRPAGLRRALPARHDRHSPSARCGSTSPPTRRARASAPPTSVAITAGTAGSGSSTPTPPTRRPGPRAQAGVHQRAVRGVTSDSRRDVHGGGNPVPVIVSRA